MAAENYRWETWLIFGFESSSEHIVHNSTINWLSTIQNGIKKNTIKDLTILLWCKAINMQLKGASTCVRTDLKHPTYFPSPFNPKVTTCETQIPISWCFLIHTLVSKKKNFFKFPHLYKSYIIDSESFRHKNLRFVYFFKIVPQFYKITI